MKLVLTRYAGYCGGVLCAIRTAEEALLRFGPGNVTILHELVHNETTVRVLLDRGMRFADSLDQIPAGTAVLFSAHGVSEAVECEALARGLTVLDSTCPRVKEVQGRARAQSEAGRVVLLAGKRRHREVEGILGRIPGEAHLLETLDDARAFSPASSKTYALICQTTFHAQTRLVILDCLRAKLGDRLVESGSVCDVTEKRQREAAEFARRYRSVLVVGSDGSSNTMRLVETAAAEGASVWRVTDESDLSADLLSSLRAAVAPSASLALVCGASVARETLLQIHRILAPLD